MVSYDNYADEYGNFFSAAGETRLNFLIRAWWIGRQDFRLHRGEFRGSTSWFKLRYLCSETCLHEDAVANDALTIGHTWQKWGYIPTYSSVLLGFNMLTAFQRGSRQPQIMWDHNFNKNFNFSVGASPPQLSRYCRWATRWTALPKACIHSSRSISYTSDACGKIGPWQMLFSLSGFYGWERPIYSSLATTSTSYACAQLAAQARQWITLTPMTAS